METIGASEPGVQTRVHRRFLVPASDGRTPAPPSLWLTITEHKITSGSFRHIWGTAHVSTSEDGSDDRPVQSLRLRIEMVVPVNGPPTIDDRTRSDAAECSASCIYIGDDAEDLPSRWEAWATDVHYGTCKISNSW